MLVLYDYTLVLYYYIRTFPKIGSRFDCYYETIPDHGKPFLFFPIANLTEYIRADFTSDNVESVRFVNM
jgi:hypothetical protein